MKRDNDRGAGAGTPASSIDSLQRIERTEQRLWLLALALFLLLAASVLALDATAATVERVITGMTLRVKNLLDDYATSGALLCIVLLVCAYVYEKLVMVRRENRELMRALDSSARSLALRNQQLDTWNQVSHRLITNFNLPRLLELIVRTAAKVTESDCALVMLAQGSEGHLRLAAIHQSGLQTELARRVAARVIETGEHVCLRPEALPEDLDRPDLAWEDLVSLAGAPLVAANAIRGALLVGRLHPHEAFSDRILEGLGSFASQASIALEKAHLYGQSQRQLDRLAKLLDDLRSTQHQLHRCERLAGLGALGRGVAHVVDGPLAGAVACAEQLVQGCEASGEENRDGVAAIHQQATRARDTLRSLLALCRRCDEGGWRRVNVNRVLQEVIELMRGELGASGIAVCPSYGDVPEVSGNAVQLEQAFANIVLRASATPTDGGRVAVETRADQLDWVTVTVEGVHGDSSPVALEEDEIAPLSLKSAAESEVEVAAAEWIVRSHGGEMEVTGDPGRRVRFLIRLPAAALGSRAEQTSDAAAREAKDAHPTGVSTEV